MIRIKRQTAAKSCAAMIFVLCCLCVLSLAPAVAAEADGAQFLIPKASEDYDKGMALEGENKIAKARKFYEFGSSKGDPWCMYRLGIFYIEGRAGIVKGNDHGIKLFKRAARLNHPDANYLLGDYYLEGKYGLKKDPEKGLELILKAAELGQRDAVSRVGFLYLHGAYGVEKDGAKALELLNGAIDQGDDIVAFIVGTCYEDGLDVEQNFKTAVDYYEKAMFLGNKGAKDRIYNLVHLPSLVYGCNCPQLVRDYYEDLNVDTDSIATYEKSAAAVEVVESDKVINSDADFKGLPAIVRGIVTDITDDEEGNRYVTLYGPEGTYRNVKCVFDKEKAKELADLKKEDIINANGVYEGVKNGCVVVKDCKAIPAIRF